MTKAKTVPREKRGENKAKKLKILINKGKTKRGGDGGGNGKTWYLVVDIYGEPQDKVHVFE